MTGATKRGGQPARCVTALTIASLLPSLWACGRAEGESGSSSGIVYDGSRAPANIDASTSVVIAIGALSSAIVSSSALTRPQTSGGEAATMEGPAPETLEAIADDGPAEPISGEGGVAPGALRVVSESSPGSCGGALALDGLVDDATGIFDLLMDFQDLCEGGMTTAGRADTHGTAVSPTTGSLSLVSEELRLRDEARDFTVMWRDVILDFTIDGTKVAYTNDGVFYHPDHGYLFVQTLALIEGSTGQDFPHAGALRIIEDGPDPDSAQLIVMDSTSYRIEIDLDDDGTVDETIDGLWSDLP